MHCSHPKQDIDCAMEAVSETKRFVTKQRNIKEVLCAIVRDLDAKQNCVLICRTNG